MSSDIIIVAGNGHCAWAAAHGISKEGFDLKVVTSERENVPPDLKPNVAFEEDLKSAVRSLEPKLVVLAGYHKIVSSLELARCSYLNLHYSLLPRYRGFHTVIWAMLNGESEIGCTLHEVDSEIDHGDIVWQERFIVGNKTSRDLIDEIDAWVSARLGRVVRDYLDENIIPRPQDHSKAIYCGRRNLADCEVRWEWSAEYFERFLRALVPPYYPLPFFTYKGNKYEIAEAEVLFCNYHEIPGHIVHRNKEGVWIKLSDGVLLLKAVLINGNKKPAAQVFKKAGLRLSDRSSLSHRP